MSHDPTPYVSRARVTRPTPPKPSCNPMQFVQIKPCNLYQSAQQQLKKVEEIKKVKEVLKEPPEDWQNGTEGPLNKKTHSDPEVSGECVDFIEREFSTTTFVDHCTEQHNKHESLNRNNLNCIFCKQQTRRVASKRQYCSKAGDDIKSNILKFASSLSDENLLKELNTNENLSYHPVCLTLYRKKFGAYVKEDKEPSEWHTIRHFHAVAYDILSGTIRTDIIQNEEIFTMSDIYSQYMAILKEQCKDHKLVFENYPTHRLQSKLLNDYGETIIIHFSKALHQNIIHKKDINVSNLVDNSLMDHILRKGRLQNLGYEVRQDIMCMEHKKLPKKLTPQNIIEGECNVPEALRCLITTLVSGPDKRRGDKEEDNIRIKSICEDIIYAAHKGRVKPAKHLKLGLTIKTITNSKKVLQLLNRLGHSIGYTTAEELETEMTYTAYENNKMIPSGISTSSSRSTHVAFDNYDRFVETLDGKDTLHDTVGIIYQFKTENQVNEIRSSAEEIAFMDTVSGEENTEVNETSSSPTTVTRTRRRKRFDEIPKEITPYLKKPKALTKLTPLNDLERNTASRDNAIIRDLIWMFCVSQMPAVTPMWTGFNSKTLKDDSCTQMIDYLPQINMSPTSYTVVHETMTLAENIRKECHQQYIIATYDLQIAKMAMQIQIEEAPKFDNVFVNLGGFHIQLSFFKALGKFVDSCGIENILIDSEVMAAGSVNGVISGKHYNRCRRVHTLLSAALQSMHLEVFLRETLLQIEGTHENLISILENQTDPTAPLSLSPPLKEISEKYMNFAEATLNGEHGKTAQYFMCYISFMNIYFRFSRSIRTSDFLLLTETLFEMSNLFFLFHHQNYARWTLKYIANLQAMKTEKPSLLKEFVKGAFGVKRSHIDLSRSPVDLALEQTVNVNAGNTLTGLTHMTNSIGARQRWALSHSMRYKVVTSIMEDVRLTEKDDVSSELKLCHLEKDKHCLDKLIEGIKNSMNPFSEDCRSDELFNISTGRSAKKETAEFLLNGFKSGESEKLQFIDECNNDASRFERPIKNKKILNFASEAIKKIQKTGGKTVQLKMKRDIFGRLLALSLKHQIDIETCMKFPLAPVPPALAQYNGIMMQTQKSKLRAILTKNFVQQGCSKEEVLFIDGYHLLRRLGTMPQSYGKNSEQILTKVCRTHAHEIHLIFDVYKSPSIKDAERQKRREYVKAYQITGETQSRDSNFQKSLSNIGFKKAIVEFLAKHWENSHLAGILSDKKVYLTVGQSCYSYQVQGNNIAKGVVPELECHHEEADTRNFFHLSKMCTQRRALIQASDTDVFVILLGNMETLPAKEIWLTSSSSSEALNCTELFDKLGAHFCKALPFLHAFTGCDYNASFKGKGKIKPLAILKSKCSYQKLFAELTNPAIINDMSKMKIIQTFTNQMYSRSDDDVNNARVHIFNKKYGSQSTTGPFLRKIHSFDSGNIPPCWNSLKQQILRAIYINSMWLSATEPNCQKNNPEDCGWMLNTSTNSLEPNWFEGDPICISKFITYKEILSFVKFLNKAEKSGL